MYEEEEKRGFPLRDLIVKLIVAVVFVLLLVWLLPKVDLTGLNNRIFKDNVNDMKEAAITYFTTDRLPQKEGDSVTLTLQEMLDMKLVLPFTDKYGKTCDTRNSYVTLTKKSEEYEMKVNLKCSKEEDYIIVHLGCYSYCKTAICEKEEEPKPVNNNNKGNNGGGKGNNPKPSGKPSCVLTISRGKKGENGWYVGNVTVSFKSKKTTNSGAKITSYGIGLSEIYNKENSYVVTDDGTTKVFGYVKDSKGETAVCSVVVKKDTAKPSCSMGVLSGTKNENGDYISNVNVGFTSRTDSTSGISSYGVTTSSKATYNSKTNYIVKNIGTTKVYGYVKDKAGNKAVCDVTVKKVKVKEIDYSEPSCSLEVEKGTMGDNNWYRSDVVIGFKSKKTTNGAHITDFGLGTSTTYNGKNTYTIDEDGNKVIYGYVKDSKGNTAVCSIKVKRDATKPDCSLAVQSGSYEDGHYTSDVVIGFKKKYDKTSGIGSYGIGKSTTYKNNNSYKVTQDGTHTIYGYVKDKAGNTNVCSIKVIKKDKVYEYEYKKTWGNEYSEWSDWTTSTYDPKNPPKFGKTDTKITEDLGKKEVFDKYVYTVGKPIYGKVIEKTGSITEKVCKGYDYYRTTTTSTKVYAVKVGSNDGWKYYGMTKPLKEKPADTLTTKYVYAGTDWSYCDETCTSSPYKIFKIYTREVGTLTASDTIKISSSVTVKCSAYETKTTYLFSQTTSIVGYEQNRKAQYKTIYQYRYKTRKLIKEAGYDIKWSESQNDKTLINKGYKLTGKKRVKG